MEKALSITVTLLGLMVFSVTGQTSNHNSYFNCTVLASDAKHARIMDGSFINIPASSVICVKCVSSLEFFGFWFPTRGPPEVEWPLRQENTTCFKAVGDTNLTAAANNPNTTNADINITFYVRVNEDGCSGQQNGAFLSKSLTAAALTLLSLLTVLLTGG